MAETLTTTSSPTPHQAKMECAAEAKAAAAGGKGENGSGGDGGGLSAALQEALGVTKTGTCARHVNCPVLLKDNAVVSCRVCFSEEKSVGIQQRKSFAAVVNQLHRMGQQAAAASSGGDVTAPAAEDGGSGGGGGEDKSSAGDAPSSAAAGSQGPSSSSSSSSSSSGGGLLLQPQSHQALESIMKRLAQVQNWMLRQKEKEVVSLQLNIHRMEQRMKDQEAKVAEQKETIRALRRTIQQDLKIIKTMATQKEREIEAEKQQSNQLHMSMSTEGGEDEKDDGDDDDDDDDEDSAALMYGSPVRKMDKGKGPRPPTRNRSFEASPPTNRVGIPPARNHSFDGASPPSGEAISSSAIGSPPSIKRSDPPMEKFAKRRGKRNVLASPSSPDKKQQQQQQQQMPMRRVPPVRTHSADLSIPEDAVVKDFDDDLHSAEGEEDGEQRQQPHMIYFNSAGSAAGSATEDGGGLNKPRSSEYWSDEDLTFANDPSKIFASFRGGLLDIPKSPPPAHHNREKQKLKLKVKMDQQGKMALKLPSMRHIGRSLSGMSDATGESLDVSGLKDNGATGIPLNLLASQLQTLPSLDHSTHTQRSILDTPGSLFGDESPAGATASTKPMVEKAPAAAEPGPPPPAPVLSLLGGTDASEEGADEEDLFGQKKDSGGTSATAASTAAGSLPGRVALSSIIGKEKKDEVSAQEGSIVTATYSVETLESRQTKDSKQLSTCTSSSNASVSSVGGAGKALPILVERMNESSTDLNAEENQLFAVSRASCQDRYGDPGIYTGTILVTEGLPHGQGTMNYESGRVYEGEWLSGHWNGKGNLLNPNGDTYEGEFVFDARHGQGTYKWDNGDVYVGSFSQDKRHGHGKFNFHNGNVYEGEFVDGMFEGFGKYVFSGGSYEGEWKAGRYEGSGELRYANGGKYTGEFRNSVAHGFGLEISADGQKRRGVWEDGQPVEYFEKSDKV